MKIVIARDYEDLSRTAADIVLGEMLHDRRVNMALTAGASPAGTYEIVTERLRGNGGLDLMLIGLGADGHFCGNMPYATRFDQETYTYEFKDSYPWYEDALRLLPDPAEVPSHVVTMGAAMLAKVRRLVLIVSGAAKADALAGMLEREISTDFPATILRTHPNLVVVADREAASRLG
ncbi:6-phosphogluconolactonase [Streptomyces sp. NPDC002082]|uniref:6-phosphogluconolactonase n=1 Tax=Streptomyces sp. NPDC002082 TaxID=3154772 RepID=UPI00332D46C6